MLLRIDAVELKEWELIYNEQPWGEQRADLRTAIVAATVENWSQRKSGEMAKPSDYMPYYRKEPLTRKQLKAKLMAWGAAMGAVEVKPSGHN